MGFIPLQEEPTKLDLLPSHKPRVREEEATGFIPLGEEPPLPPVKAGVIDSALAGGRTALADTIKGIQSKFAGLPSMRPGEFGQPIKAEEPSIARAIRPEAKEYQKIPYAVGAAGTDILTLFLPWARAAAPLGESQALAGAGEKIAEYVSKIGATGIVPRMLEKAPAYIPKTAEAAAMFAGAGATKATTPEESLKSAAEGVAVAPFFTLATLPASRLIRAGATGGVGYAQSKVQGANEEDTAINTALMMFLGALTPQLRARVKIEAKKNPDAKIEELPTIKEVKDQVAPQVDEVVKAQESAPVATEGEGFVPLATESVPQQVAAAIPGKLAAAFPDSAETLRLATERATTPEQAVENIVADKVRQKADAAVALNGKHPDLAQKTAQEAIENGHKLEAADGPLTEQLVEAELAKVKGIAEPAPMPASEQPRKFVMTTEEYRYRNNAGWRQEKYKAIKKQYGKDFDFDVETGDWWRVPQYQYVDAEAYSGNYGKRYPVDVAEADHEAIVSEALKEGKPVPAEVLKDYPELVPKTEPLPPGASVSENMPTTEAPKTPLSPGSTVKVGKSPQTHTIVEELPLTEAEKAMGERYFKVKNDKTGKVETLESRDIKQVKPKGGGGATVSFFGTGQITPLLNKIKQSPTGRKLLEFFSPLSTLPESEQFKALRNIALGGMDRVDNLIDKLHVKLGKLSDKDKTEVFRFLDGQIPESSLSPEVQPIAKQMRNMNNIIGKMMVKRGLISKETFNENRNIYIHYSYLKHILGPDAIIPVQGGQINTGILKARKDLAPDQRKAIGLIEDVSIAQPLGVGKALHNTVAHDYYAKIAENPKWVWQPSRVDVLLPGATKPVKMSIGKLASEVEIARKMAEAAPNSPEIAQRLQALESAYHEAQRVSGNLPDGFTQMPDSAAYGPLAGAYVRTQIARDILPVVDSFQSKNVMSSMANTILDWERKGMTGFKVGKTALNIPTAIRNTISNFIQLNMSGIPAQDIPGFMAKAAQSMKAKDAIYVQAKRNGIFKTNWGQAEIAEVLDTVRMMEGKGINGVFAQLGKIAKYYGKIDDFFKLTKFIEQVESGVGVEKAAIEAQKWGMDYSLAHPTIKLARRHIMPFVSYSYKIAPLIAETMAERPWVIAKYVVIPYLMAEGTKSAMNITDQEWDKLKKELPAFVKNTGSLAPLWWRSPEGNVQWVNLEYFFPWQQFTALGRGIADKNADQVVGSLGIGNPYLDVYSMAKSLKGESPPKDPFTGKDIFNRLDAPTDKAYKMSLWFYDKWGPSMLNPETGALGYTRKVGEKDSFGRTITLGQAAGRWVGANIVAPTKQQYLLEKRAKVSELKASLMRMATDKSPGAKERLAAAMVEFKRLTKEIQGKDE